MLTPNGESPMIDELRYQFEIRDDAATLYLAGAIEQHTLQRLRAACDALPDRVKTLRVDMHAMPVPGPGTVSAVRALLHDWRDVREGAFRLSLRTEHLVATYREDGEEVDPAATRGAWRQSHALMGTFL